MKQEQPYKGGTPHTDDQMTPGPQKEKKQHTKEGKEPTHNTKKTLKETLHPQNPTKTWTPKRNTPPD